MLPIGSDPGGNWLCLEVAYTAAAPRHYSHQRSSTNCRAFLFARPRPLQWLSWVSKFEFFACAGGTGVADFSARGPAVPFLSPGDGGAWPQFRGQGGAPVGHSFLANKVAFFQNLPAIRCRDWCAIPSCKGPARPTPAPHPLESHRLVERGSTPMATQRFRSQRCYAARPD